MNYPRYIFLPGLLSMFFFRVVLRKNKRFILTRLMGSGKNGGFDIWPDWHQWAICSFSISPVTTPPGCSNYELINTLYGKFIADWCKRFGCETCVIVTQIAEGHGSWSGYRIAERSNANEFETGAIAVLTRATIRLSRLSAFWKQVGPINRKMAQTEGLVYSIGIGEIPLIRQATFSIWKSKKDMMAFAYSMQEHREVIAKTRKENWYSEEMFLRLKPVTVAGTVKGISFFQPPR